MNAKFNEREIKLFHENFRYMWKKLNTSYYVVKQQPDKAKALGITAGDFLPAYRICSKIVQDDHYVPTKRVLDGIVNFYNANIQPPVDSIQFVQENLEDTNEIRFRSSAVRDEVFIGKYYGHYKSASEDGGIVGAYLCIYREYNSLRASVINGIRNDEAMMGEELYHIFDYDKTEKGSLSSVFQKRYNQYYENQEKMNQRTSFYQGSVEITKKSLIIYFYEFTVPNKKMVLTMNLVSFPEGREICNGGMAYVLATSDGSFDTRFYKMGITNQENGCLPLEDSRVVSLLKIKSEEYCSILTTSEDRSWYELILASIVDGSLLIPATRKKKDYLSGD